MKSKCKKYGYDFTQEGECVIIGVDGLRYTFSTPYHCGNWFYYHEHLDCNSVHRTHKRRDRDKSIKPSTSQEKSKGFGI